MLSKEDNELLCFVEEDAPMGQLMRRFWVPVCMSEEMTEARAAPRRVRLFGEDLVVFRGADGTLGLIGEHCPHRRASLVFGRVGACSLTCLYHGWEISAEGRVLDMPSEPPESLLQQRVRHPAYPVRDDGGIIWTYMGSPELKPTFPELPWMASGNSIATLKIHEAANWTQTLEGSLDSAHTSSLHSAAVRSGTDVAGSTNLSGETETVFVRPSADKAPRIQVQYTGYGLRYAALRKPFQDAETTDYVRVTVYIAPFITFIPTVSAWRTAQLTAPIDNHNTMFYFVTWSDTMELDSATFKKQNNAVVGVDLDENYRKVRTLANNYLQDRVAMKEGDFTGIAGIPNQDMAMQESAGSIVDRTRENLGASDVAIVRFRQMMIRAARDFADGKLAFDPAGTNPSLNQILPFEGLVKKDIPWRTLAVTDAEISGFRSLIAPQADR